MYMCVKLINIFYDLIEKKTTIIVSIDKTFPLSSEMPI